MDKDFELEHKKEYLSKLVLNGFISAMHSHKELFKSVFKNDDNQKLTVALTYLNEAHTYYVNAETLLADNVEIFDIRSEFEELFHRFSVYNKEVLTNARTDHSHQWSDIEFRAFVESFKVVSDLLNLDEEKYWIDQALSSDEE